MGRNDVRILTFTGASVLFWMTCLSFIRAYLTCQTGTDGICKRTDCASLSAPTYA